MSSLFPDLSSIRLEGSLRLMQIDADGAEKPIATAGKIIPCNLIAGSLFNQNDISFNGYVTKRHACAQLNCKSAFNLF